MSIFGTWEAWILYWILIIYGNQLFYMKQKEKPKGLGSFGIALAALLGVFFIGWYIGWVK